MPNHITTIITVDSKDDNVIASLLDEHEQVDFNKVVPMPKQFEIFNQTGLVMTGDIYDEFEKYLDALVATQNLQENENKLLTQEKIDSIVQDFFEAVEQSPSLYKSTYEHFKGGNGDNFKTSLANELSCLILTGTTDVLAWSRNNWGTKWNAYDTEVDGDGSIVRFDTAWASPDYVIEALSKKFPNAILNIEYADEDLGSNCGSYSIQNGEKFNIQDEHSMGEYALDFASNIKHGMTYAELNEEDID